MLLDVVEELHLNQVGSYLPHTQLVRSSSGADVLA
jgi:hypothetical protein